MAYPAYPSTFREPDYVPYVMVGRAGVQRTPFDAGNTRQRRQYRNMPFRASLRFVMTYKAFGLWEPWWNFYAYEWFTIPIASHLSGQAGQRCLKHVVRCISDLQVTALRDPSLVEITVDIELSEDQPFAPPTPNPDAWGDWLISGTPSNPSAAAADTGLWYDGGSPASPSTNVIKAGRPRNPSAQVT